MLFTKPFALAGRFFCLLILFALFTNGAFCQDGRTTADFDKGWHFHLGDVPDGDQPATADADCRALALPTDWSIEAKFSKSTPARPEGGALPGGIGWYRKTFTVPAASKGKLLYIDIDGAYQKSTVWVNGHQFGFRPN